MRLVARRWSGTAWRDGMPGHQTLLFVSPRFLFPVDSGGKIRTTQTLRGLKGGHFRIRLLSPATPALFERHRSDLETVCDEFLWWPGARKSPMAEVIRAVQLVDALPMPVRADWSSRAAALVRENLDLGPDVVVFDFVHAAVLAPVELGCPSVLFTHNVEAEIFERHAKVARNAVMRALWRAQTRKMQAFEAAALHRFDVVVAVSDRDAGVFAGRYGVPGAVVLPTGVDLEYFGFCRPDRGRDVVFCGSMDWLANQDAVSYFMDEVWDLVTAEVPDARMTVIGRSPPPGLVKRAATRGLNWVFTGFVDDVRPHANGAAVAVIPMRVAGGTRLKVFESMASGTPVVSTAIGVEGLPVEDGRHYLRAEDPQSFARAVVRLMKDAEFRERLADEARRHVEDRFSYRVAARAFEEACVAATERR